MWFLSAPHNSNTSYYKIITDAVFAKRFPKRLQLHQKELLHMRRRSPAKQVLSITLRLAQAPQKS
jgi:hypothetical protein